MFRLLSLYNPTTWDITFHTEGQRTFFLDNIGIPIGEWEQVLDSSNLQPLCYLLDRTENIVMMAQYKHQQQTFDVLITDCSAIDLINQRHKEMMEDTNKAMLFKGLPLMYNHCYADHKDITENDWKVGFSKHYKWDKI